MRPYAVLLLLLGLLAACAGEGDKPPRSTDGVRQEEPASSAPRPQADVAGAVLGAARKSSDVETSRGEFSMAMDFGGFEFSLDGEMLFRAPDQMHMTMDMFGSDLEMLIYGADLYMNVGGAGWRTVDLSDAGIDLDQFQDLWENRGLFDIEELAESFGEDIEQLEDSTIDGVTYEHYHVEPDPATMAENLPEGLIDASLLEQVQTAIQSIESDFYIDPQTGLVRRVTLSMEMDIPNAGSGGMEMTMDMLEYNGDVDIPAEPVGAPLLDPDDFAPGT